MADNLFKRRREQSKELSQMKIAVSLGVSLSTVRAWEEGRSFPRRKLLRRVSEVYGVSMESLAKEHATAVVAAAK